MSSRKKGQVTLFIILGIIIFSSILAFIVWVRPTMDSSKGASLNFETCVKKIVSEGVSDLAITGGFKYPTFGVLYKDQQIPYFVYTSQYDEAGTAQVLFPAQKFEEELTSYVEEGINACYKTSVKKLQNMGYNVTSGDVKIVLTIFPETIDVLVQAPTTIESQQFEEINVKVPSDIYGILEMAHTIMSKELERSLENSWSVDTTELMRLYQNYVITSIYRSDSTRIYTIKDMNYNIEYKFAIRSQVMGTVGDALGEGF